MPAQTELPDSRRSEVALLRSRLVSSAVGFLDRKARLLPNAKRRRLERSPLRLWRSGVRRSLCVSAQRFSILQLRADLELLFGIFFVLNALLRLNLSLGNVVLPAFLYFNLIKIRFAQHSRQRRLRFASGITQDKRLLKWV